MKSEMPTNAEYLANLLLDLLHDEGIEFKREYTDDGGASIEAMAYYNINCPYKEGDKRAECKSIGPINRDECATCRYKWLTSKVDE